MIREDISLSNVEWEWNEEAETLSKRERQPDTNKATFFSKLLPIAQERLQNIRLVWKLSCAANYTLLPL